MNNLRQHLNPNFLSVFASQWGKSQREDEALMAKFSAEGIDPPPLTFFDDIGAILSAPSKIQPQGRV